MKKLALSIIIVMFGCGIAFAGPPRSQTCTQDCGTKFNSCIGSCQRTYNNSNKGPNTPGLSLQGCKNTCNQTKNHCLSGCAQAK